MPLTGPSDPKFFEDLNELLKNMELDGIFILLGNFNIDLTRNYELDAL